MFLHFVCTLFVTYTPSYGTIFNYVLCFNYYLIILSLEICYTNGLICCIHIVYEITNIWDYSDICPILSLLSYKIYQNCPICVYKHIENASIALYDNYLI